MTGGVGASREWKGWILLRRWGKNQRLFISFYSRLVMLIRGAASPGENKEMEGKTCLPHFTARVAVFEALTALTLELLRPHLLKLHGKLEGKCNLPAASRQG